VRVMPFVFEWLLFVQATVPDPATSMLALSCAPRRLHNMRQALVGSSNTVRQCMVRTRNQQDMFHVICDSPVAQV